MSRNRAVRITNAAPSRQSERRRREITYSIMMLVRALSLIAATILVSVHAPLLWLWLPILLFGVIFVPWFAVIIANDRSRPKDQYRHQPRPQASQLALEADPAPTVPAPRTIDADPDD